MTYTDRCSFSWAIRIWLQKKEKNVEHAQLMSWDIISCISSHGTWSVFSANSELVINFKVLIKNKSWINVSRLVGGICNLYKQHKHPILQNRTELPLTNTHTFTSYAHKHPQPPISLSQRKVIPRIKDRHWSPPTQSPRISLIFHENTKVCRNKHPQIIISYILIHISAVLEKLFSRKVFSK